MDVLNNEYETRSGERLTQAIKREHAFLADAVCAHNLNCLRDATYAFTALTTVHHCVKLLIKHGFLPADANLGRQQIGSITRTIVRVDDISLWMRDYWDIVDLLDTHTPYSGQDAYRILSAHIGLGLMIGASNSNSAFIKEGAHVMKVLPSGIQRQIMGSNDSFINVYTNVQ